MKRLLWVVSVFCALACTSCAKPMMDARVLAGVQFFSGDYAAQPNDVYYAIRWAFRENGYALSDENLTSGVITSTWAPIKSDSHFMPLFGRRDYGVTNSYYQMEVHVTPEDGRTMVEVGTRIKSLVPNLESAGVEEKKVLADIGDYLRKTEPSVSNLGIDE